jgi:molecular chaperone GrpE
MKDPKITQKKDDKKKKNIDLDELLKKAEKESEDKEEEAEKALSRDEELEQYKNQALRAMADLQNVKKRMDQDRQDFVKYASANLLTKLLPVLDNFERAFSNLPEDIENHDWLKGVVQIEKSFIDVLTKEGLEKISPKNGEDFDTNLHECVMQDQTQKQGKIAQCLETGYQLKGKVLRVAKASVGSK